MIVHVNSATNVVEAIISTGAASSVTTGQYAVAGVPDYCVAVGFICDRMTATFVPPPAPAVDTMEAQIADLQAQLDAIKAASGLV